MELQVTLTLSDRLFALLEDKLPNLGRRIEKAITKEIGAQTRRESSIAVSVNTQPQASTGTEQNTESQIPQNTPEIQSPAEGSVPTLTDCRAALARCRERFEGDDKDNKESERYRKYHKAISAQCKQIILEVSGGTAEKIPDLKDEQRAAFISAMDALILDEKGLIAPPPAPY